MAAANIRQQQQAAPAPLKKKGAGLNQLIAKTHKLNGQLLGLQITNGNLIAIGLSAAQITAGVIVFAWMAMQVWSLVLILLTAPLAILVERLSLGGMMVFHTAGKQKVKLEDDFHLKHIKKDATDREKYEYQRQLKRLTKDRRLAVGLILLGIGLSGFVGDQFWQVLFKSVADPTKTILSLGIASAVSLTFVFSELYAELSDDGIIANMRDNRMSKAVLAGSEEELQLELSMEAFGNMRSDPAKRASVVNKIESGLTKRLEGFADRAEYLLTEGNQQQVGRVEVKQIEAGDMEYEDVKTKLEILMRNNPKMTRQQQADHFGVAKSTMQDWVKRLRSEVSDL